MLVIDLRGRSIDSMESLWNVLTRPCGLPEWFGRDLDAWNDALRGGISSIIDEHPLILIRVDQSGLFASDDPYGSSFVEVTESSGKGHVHTVPADMFEDFPAFAPAFEPGPLETVAYLVLLNLNRRQSEAVLIVARCLDAAEDKRRQISNLLGGSSHWPMTSLDWRPHLVGCVAILAANPRDRPLDSLLEAASRPSWVSPQLLATTALADVPDWPRQLESAILDRGDAKAAAAFRALDGESSDQLIDLANRDTEYGDEIALGWSERITTAFDGARIPRSW